MIDEHDVEKLLRRWRNGMRYPDRLSPEEEALKELRWYFSAGKCRQVLESHGVVAEGAPLPEFWRRQAEIAAEELFRAGRGKQARRVMDTCDLYIPEDQLAILEADFAEKGPKPGGILGEKDGLEQLRKLGVDIGAA